MRKTRNRQMHQSKRFAIFILLALCGPLLSLVRADIQEIVESWQSAAVRVSVPGENEGFGFIVGERAGELYILTAEHLVAAMPGKKPRIEVYFRQDRRVPVKAEVLARTGKRLDAALLRVNKPKRVTWRPGPYCTPPYNPPEPVRFIGRDKKWFVSRGRDEGQINEPIPDFNGHIEVSIGSVRPGVSGAPLLNAKGLVGMIVKDRVNSAKAVAIEDLHRFVYYQGYPWDLLKCGTTPIPVASPPSVVPPADDGDWTDPVTGMEFLRIKKGCFQMGSPPEEKHGEDNEKLHRVCVDGFWMGKYEVTQAQWKQLMGDNPSNFKGENLPVEQVSWIDAQKFVEKLNQRNTGAVYRLPAEAEWEYAARAGTSTPFHTGECISTDQANYDGDYAYGNCPKGGVDRQKTIAVGSLASNDFGLYDMHGNVWEWTCSEYEENYNGEESRCSSKNHANGLRVLRGGSWYSLPRDVRAAYRDRNTPDYRDYNLGFRLARIK
ncbi:MAG: SUMF1/EgtB/PvdO family nonheme iron enzyme [Gammaproteobacteria bacterium]|nr:SUMF1/EgtB/PvdO family nonheme iron enzyme [Gammaproteobacteria bacterium]